MKNYLRLSEAKIIVLALAGLLFMSQNSFAQNNYPDTTLNRTVNYLAMPSEIITIKRMQIH